MIQEQKILVGGMDKDNSPESMNLYDYIDAHNIRTVGNGESEGNYLTNVTGNRLITLNLPVGENRVIGSKGFEIVSKAYFIRYNTMGRHQIVEFNYDTLVENIVFENYTDTGEVDVLGWSSEVYFSDIRLMHQRFLILTDGVNPVYFINIESFKENRGNIVFREEDLLLIKVPPTSPPEVEYHNFEDRTTNALRGKLFQFKYQFEYEDYKTSTWSPTSRRAVPEDEPSEGQGQTVSNNNALLITLNVGDYDRVETVNVGMRWGLDKWLLIKAITRDAILNLPSPPTDISSDRPEFYNPTTGEYSFIFYNDGTYPLLDNVEVESQYDYIPHTAESVEVINGNILAVGGIVEGYNRPRLGGVSTNVSYYEPNLSFNVDDPVGNFYVAAVNFYWGSGQERRYWDIFFAGTPAQGDVFELRLLAIGTTVPLVRTYIITANDETLDNNQVVNNIANALVGQMPPGSSVGYSSGYLTVRSENEGSQWQVQSAIVSNVNIGTLSTRSVPALKTGASYQWAYAPYDKFGRFFPIVTGKEFVVNTKTLAETEGLLPQINWYIGRNAPSGAVGYKILLSENQTYQNYVTLTGVYDSTQGGNYLVFNLKSLDRFNRLENESNVTYDFTKGDKVKIIRAVSPNQNKWAKFPFLELDIVDFTIEVNPSDETDVRYLLKVRNTPLWDEFVSDLTVGDIDLVMEIFTPKGDVVDATQGVFYEIGLDYPIVDGINTATYGNIREGDSYYRARLFFSENYPTNSVAVPVEDPHFSDNYESRYWNAGRARTYYDEPERTERQASLRYSDEFTIGTRYNGINRFYSERIYGEQGGQTTSRDGWIRRLEMRNNSLVCIQEFKVGIIPIYKSIIFDNTNNAPLVADTGRIFGDVQYRVGDYGLGTAKESVSVSKGGVIYFFDDNACIPLRDSMSGLDVIDVNMSHYFIKYAKEAKQKGARFIGYYDNLYKEYNLTTEDILGRTITVTFSPVNTEYQDSFIPPASSLQLTQPQNGEVTISGYNVTYTPTEGYVGEDFFEARYQQGDQLTSKTVTIDVEEGNKTPDPFSLPTLNNVIFEEVIEGRFTVTGTDSRSTISIENGEYSLNDSGIWTDEEGFVYPNDVVHVRHTSAENYNTATTTTVTVEGVSADMVSTTVQSGVSSTEYNDVRLYIIPDPNNSGLTHMDIALDYSFKLSTNPVTAVRLRVAYTYNEFGSVSEGLRVLSFGNGDTFSNFAITKNIDEVVGAIIDLTYANSPRDREVIMCSDDVLRVIRIYEEGVKEV